MIVKVPDEIYLRYGSEEEVNKTLAKFCDFSMGDPILILSKSQRNRLQQLFDAVIANGDDLVKRIEKLAQVKIGSVSFNFTSEQLVRMKELAEFNGMQMKDYVVETVQQNMNQWMSTV